MFRHIVLLNLTDAAGEDDRAAIIDALATLPDRIQSIRAYTTGTDAGLADGNADICAVADFDDEAGYFVYRDHEAHTSVIAEHIAPVLASRTAIQFEL